MRADDLVGGGVDVEVLRPSLSDGLRMKVCERERWLKNALLCFLRRSSFCFAKQFTVNALLENVDGEILNACFCEGFGCGIEDRRVGGILGDGFAAGAEITMNSERALDPADD